jgi:aldose 1-epimerase
VTQPSGRQIHLTHGDHELTVVEVGAGIRTYTYGGRAVIDGYRRSEVCSGGRGQLLLPWPNRLGDGSYEFGGRSFQAPLNEPEHHNAIHGLVRWSSWTVTEATADRAQLDLRLYPQPGWGWIVDCSVTYTLSDAGAEVRTAVYNVPDGGGSCPVGIGWHPYLAAFGGLADDTVLTVPADKFYRSDPRGLPAGTQPVEGTELDFRNGRTIGPARLDTAFTDLGRDSLGRATVTLAPADGSAAPVQLWLDRSYTHLMVFTGDTLGEEPRRRRGVAIEPMTGAPDMLRTGDGRRVLAEGERLDAVWGINPAPA